MSRPLRALAFVGLLALGCGRLRDPTAILAPEPAAPATGVQFKLTRQGDGVYAITHVWVEDSLGASVLTLSTTNGLATISVATGTPPSGYCGAGGMSFYWPSYCAANPNNITDANTHATSSYATDRNLFYTWDWKDRNGAVVPDGSYTLKAELAGYNYSDIPAEASVAITKNGGTGAASGSVSGAWQAASATWAP